MDIFVILGLTLLLVYDYFPNIPFSETIAKGILIVFLGLFLFSLLFKKYRSPNNKEVLKWQIFTTIYLLFLVGIFTLLGGQSSSGIAFNNLFVWIVLFIQLFEIYSQWKKVKRSEA